MSQDPSPHDAAFQPPSLEELSALLPQFELQGFLAQGGMGAVYLARQISLDRQVAIKVLPPAWGAEAGYAQRFQTEARAMAKLQHNHIVGVFDFGITSAGHLYLVMEYVRGETLHELIKLKKLPRPKIQGIALQLCDGLSYAHEHGVLHRDIKPGNVLVSSKGAVKIADFGLARHAGAAVEEDALGTPDYAAPELFIQGALVDHRADIYALGIVFQEMLTGQVPGHPREPLSHHGSHFDPGWEPLIAKATSDDPSRRFRTVAELRQAVANVGKRVAQPGPAPGAPRPRVMSAGPRPAEPEPSAFPWTSVVAGMVVVSVAVFWWMRNRSELAGARAVSTSSASSGTDSASLTVSGSPGVAGTANTTGTGSTMSHSGGLVFSLDTAMPAGHAFKFGEPHTDVVNDLVTFPDQRRVASGSSDKTVAIWDLQSRRRLRTFGPLEGGVLRLAISPDGRYIAAGTTEYKTYVWDVNGPPDALPKELVTTARSIPQLAFSPDGESLVVGTNDMSASLVGWAWRKDDSSPIPGFRPVSNAIELLPGDKPGTFLVIGQRPDTSVAPPRPPQPPAQNAPPPKIPQIAEFWLGDITRRSLVRQLPTPPATFRLRITPDGRHGIASARGRLYYFNLETGHTLAQSVTIPTLAGDIELLDGGRLVLIGGQDKCLHIIETATGQDVWVSSPAEMNCTNAPAVVAGRYALTAGGRRLGPAGTPPQKDGDYSLHFWVLPDIATLKSTDADKALVHQQMLALATSDPELWELLGRLTTEWKERVASASASARKDLDEKYLTALRRELGAASPRERDQYLNEISRVSNGSVGALDPTAPPNLVRLHDIYQEQVRLLPERITALRTEIGTAQSAQLDALERKRSEAAAATRVQLAKQALTSLKGEMDRDKLLRHFLPKPPGAQ
jgi:hypothetical protein